MENNSPILTKKQTSFLNKIGENKFLSDTFYLTGGTALAACYLFHRYSEDLDFFSEKEIDVLPLNVFLESVRKELKIRNIDYQQSFNRNLFFLKYEDGQMLKSEFTYYPFSRIERGDEKNNVKIDSLLDLAVNKLFTIYQRSQIKDYIDLYFICKEKNWTIAKLTKKARIKYDWQIDPLQLGTQFVKIKGLKDFPNMIKEMALGEVEEFFVQEAKKLKKDIIELGE